MDPTTLKYTPTHEWVSLEGDLATIGISRFAVDQLTDLIMIDLPGVGDRLTPGKGFGEIESVKAVKPKSARKKFDEHGIIGLSLIGGIVLITLFYVSQTK